MRTGRVILLLFLTVAVLGVQGARAGLPQRALDADQPGLPQEQGPPTPDVAPARRIEINLPTTTLFLYEGDRLLRAYRVAVGRPQVQIGEALRKTETPTGDFVITNLVREPAWYPPRWLKKEKGWPNDYIVPPGPENPLGTRWLSFWRPGFEGFGIHGTIEPEAIGTAASLGCVRMLNHDVEDLFDLVAPGTPVRIIYEPAVAYLDGEGRWHLQVGPDLYGRGVDADAAARRELRRHGLDESVLDGERLAGLTWTRDLTLLQASVALRVRWLVGAPWIQDGVREEGGIAVTFEGLPPLLQKYFDRDAGEGMLLYARPLQWVRVRDGKIYLRLEEVAPRFGLKVEFVPGGEEAVVHF